MTLIYDFAVNILKIYPFGTKVNFLGQDFQKLQTGQTDMTENIA